MNTLGDLSNQRVAGIYGRVTRPPSKLALALKRLTDFVVSAALLIMFMPLLLAIGITVKVTSPGPVLYRWPVVGKGGRPLSAHKFRSMVVGADGMKRELWHRNEATGPVFKIRNDPRVTPVGRVLRKFSLDELPQLWNVLKGDMSLVGPRPVLSYEWEHFSEWHRRKLSVKPGIVSLWHLRGQPRDFDTWVRLDLEYIDNWSIWLDFRLLAWVVVYTLTGRNY